jgi:N-carbamoylputrescine amidase
MKMARYMTVLLLLGGSAAMEIPLSGQGPDPGRTTKSASGLLRIAVVQMKSLDHDIDGNLRRATMYADEAAAQGAQFVLFPEFMATGSYLSFDTWDSAEPSQGKSVQWLKSTSRRLKIWLAAGFFEASGADFYDAFVLTAPSGDEVGRVHKQIPAGPEGYFFRGDVGPHVISTAIGKIGVGICAENYYCFAASQFLKNSADFIVMPHSSPDMTRGGGLTSPPGTHIASWYAKKLGVPVAMVNKVGRSYKPPPNEINGIFPGRSAIVDSDGIVLQSMDDKEGIGIANITLDSGRKTRANQVCTGVGIAELAVGGPEGAAAVADEYARAQKSYDSNSLRKAKALSISRTP